MSQAPGWRDILVVAEAGPRGPAPASFEVVGKARDLADRLGARVAAAWAGSEEDGQALVHRGADELLLLEGPTPAPPRALAGAVVALARERRPEIVLASGTPLGREVAGRVAAALGVALLGGCTDLDLREEDRLLVGKRAPYGGLLAEARAVPAGRPQVATLRPGSVRAPWPDDSRYARVARVPLPSLPAGRVRPAGGEARKPPAAWRGAERLLVGGALLDAGGFEDLQALAQPLGAAWAATRAAAKLGLAPEDRALRPWDGMPAPALCIAAGIEDPLEFAVSLPRPRQLVVLGDGPLDRLAQQVVPGSPGAALKALRGQVR